MPTHPIFPTPIYFNTCSGMQYDNIQKELTNAFNKLNFTDTQNDNHDLSLNENGDLFSDNDIVKFKCNNFIDFIHNNLMDYFNDLGIAASNPEYVNDIVEPNVDYIITNSWFTKTNKGQKAPLHYHGDTDISGVYYLKTNGQDGGLQYHSNHRDYNSNFIYSKMNHRLSLHLQQGLLALWPGNLWHDTHPNLTDHERVSVSFNIAVKRKGFKVDKDALYR